MQEGDLRQRGGRSRLRVGDAGGAEEGDLDGLRGGRGSPGRVCHEAVGAAVAARRSGGAGEGNAAAPAMACVGKMGVRVWGGRAETTGVGHKEWPCMKQGKHTQPVYLPYQ